jgi:hypothetical protein
MTRRLLLTLAVVTSCYASGSAFVLNQAIFLTAEHLPVSAVNVLGGLYPDSPSASQWAIDLIGGILALAPAALCLAVGKTAASSFTRGTIALLATLCAWRFTFDIASAAGASPGKWPPRDLGLFAAAWELVALVSAAVLVAIALYRLVAALIGWLVSRRATRDRP